MFRLHVGKLKFSFSGKFLEIQIQHSHVIFSHSIISLFLFPLFHRKPFSSHFGFIYFFPLLFKNWETLKQKVLLYTLYFYCIQQRVIGVLILESFRIQMDFEINWILLMGNFPCLHLGTKITDKMTLKVDY